MSSTQDKTTGKIDRLREQAIRAGYKQTRTTAQRVRDKSMKPWHHELDELFAEALERDRS
jgi:hypothetical protein